MGVHIAGGVANRWHIEAIAAFMELAGAEQVVEPPDLAAAGHPDAFARHEQAHGPIEEPLVQLELTLLAGAEEDQPVGPVGGEGERNLRRLQPGS
jgi:hypothetical protein